MTIASFLSALLVGTVIGLLGRLVVPGRNPIGCLLTVVVGILAALLGTALAGQLGVPTDGFRWGELGIQVVLAAFGVALLSGVVRRRD